ncbi:MAG: Ig-like domain-containing protein [Methanomassiliicoccales archaeon]|nr:Ig-like domain-containing protein [Methanomassiliicoccales archaeon]
MVRCGRRAIASVFALAILSSTFTMTIVAPQVEASPAFLPPQQFAFPNDQITPRMTATSDLNITLVWATEAPGRSNIYALSSFDGGGSWTVPKRVDSYPSTFIHCQDPAIASNSSGAVFVVWSDDRSGTFRTYFSRSLDQGVNFATDMLVTMTTTGNQTVPDIAVKDDIIYVVWAEYVPGKDPDIYLARSNDSGQSFMSPVRVDHTGTSQAYQSHPTVCVNGSKVFVAWHGFTIDTNYNIYGSISLNAGASFVADIRVSDSSLDYEHARPDASFTPDGRIVVVWQDKRSGNFDIRSSYSSDNATTFTTSIKGPEHLSGPDQMDPRIAIDYRGITHLVYREGGGAVQDKVMYASSSRLASFSSSIPIRLAATDVLQEQPFVLTTPNGTVAVAYDSNEPGTKDVYFTHMLIPNIPPTVEILSPPNGSVVTGEFTITGNATDPDAIDPLHPSPFQVQVMMLNDSIVVVPWTDVSLVALPSWSYLLNSTDFDNGNYTILARSSDSLSYSDVVSINITISNAAPKQLDLIIQSSSLVFDPAAPYVGDAVNLTADVLNHGNSDAHYVAVGFYVDGAKIAQVNWSVVPAQGQVRQVRAQWHAVLGTHNISVMADANNSIPETNESNNEAWKDIVVVARPVFKPDLEVTAANITFAPSTIYENDTVSISVMVYNKGNWVASNAVISIHNETGLVANRSVSIAPGVASLVEVEWPFVPLGLHTIIVYADPQYLLGEWSYANNQAEKQFTVLPVVIDRPDLLFSTGVMLTPSPPALTDGDQATVMVMVSNDGTAPAYNVDVQFKLDGSNLNVTRIATLAPGTTEDVVLQWSAVQGHHNISVQLDYENNITEYNETNNQAWRQFDVRVRAFYIADLVLTQGNVTLYPTSPSVGTLCRINATVVNLGNDTVYNVHIVVQIDGNPLNGVLYIDRLDPNEFAQVNVTWPPTSWGPHQIKVLVDPQNEIHEMSEGNNNITVNVDLGSEPINIKPGDVVLPIWIIAGVVLVIGAFAFYRRRKRKQ